jgi:hypothetical protein
MDSWVDLSTIEEGEKKGIISLGERDESHVMMIVDRRFRIRIEIDREEEIVVETLVILERMNLVKGYSFLRLDVFSIHQLPLFGVEDWSIVHLSLDLKYNAWDTFALLKEFGKLEVFGCGSVSITLQILAAEGFQRVGLDDHFRFSGSEWRKGRLVNDDKFSLSFFLVSLKELCTWVILQEARVLKVSD